MKLSEGVARIVRANERLIRERYPKTLRRNAGYALDLILAQLDRGVDDRDLDLTRLLCGSEGTLAVTVAAKLKLFPVPKAKGLALVSFPSVDAAIEVVPKLLATGVSAVELVDDVVIEAALHNIECREYVKAFPLVNGRAPAAVLYVEYHEQSAEALQQRLAEVGGSLPAGTPVRLVTDTPGMADAWKLRKAGEPLLHGLPGDRKPLTFIEDNAVPPERLGEFVRSLRAVVEREGTRAAFWAHASVGVLHVRPLLNPHDEGDLERLQRIATEAADLAKACGGVMSGEHGDGRVRGPFLERFYGPELMRAFREVKALFDPKSILNPGNEVAPGPIASIVERTRIDPKRANGVEHGRRPAVPHVSTFFTYDDQHGFDGAVEQCNGAGVCRKQSGGTMCPSYRGTAQERHSTRGRGNALRLAITGQAGGTGGDGPAWDDAETMETLDLCLSCKACKTECPSNVDIATLKAEYTAQRYRQRGRVPLAALITGHVRVLNRLGSFMPGLANRAAASGVGKWLAEKLMGIDQRRPLPRFEASLYSKWGSSTANSAAPRVALFGDCFTLYNEPGIGLAARSVLGKLGFETTLARHGCCGRSMISVGMLEQASATVDATLAQLKPLIDDPAVEAILFLEPSCLSAVKDDWLRLKCATPLDVRERLAAKAMLVEQFIESKWGSSPRTPTVAVEKVDRVLLHAHCHQKALWGADSSGALLRRVLGDRFKTLQTGCCGMAGSFGYDRDKFDLSVAIANLPAHQGGVMPAVEQASAGGAATVCATGTSCRHQIRDVSGGRRTAMHPVELLDRLLEP
ncbi:MAG: FAD-linked oxidase C-terminal domain-containing protein [Phycisphaerales bacterium]